MFVAGRRAREGITDPGADNRTADGEAVQVDTDIIGADVDAVYASGNHKITRQLITAGLRDYIWEASGGTIYARGGHGGLIDLYGLSECRPGGQHERC